MPLPEKVIEQLGREPVKTPGWSLRLVTFTGGMFFLSLVVYAGIGFGYQAYLESRLQRLDKDIQEFSNEIPAEKQKDLLSFYSQLLNIRSVLAGRARGSNLFSWLERNTDSEISFSKFNLNAVSGQLSLGGLARRSEDISRQVAIFAAQPEVARVSFNNATLVGGIWQFDISVAFNVEFLKRAGVAAQSPAQEPQVYQQ